MKHQCMCKIKWFSAGSSDNPRYADNDPAQSEFGIELRRSLGAILCDGVEQLNSNQLDHIGRLLSDALSYVRKINEGKYARITRADSFPKSFRLGEKGEHEGSVPSFWHSWWDHPERYRCLDSATTAWCAHPYSLSTESMKDLIRIEEMGHRVDVSGRSWYFPGNTLLITVGAKKHDEVPVAG